MASARQRQAAAGAVKSPKKSRKAAPMKRPSKLNKRTGKGVGGKKAVRPAQAGPTLPGRAQARTANAKKKAAPPKAEWAAAQMLPNPSEERFCQLYADGRFSGRSCYAQAFGCENEGSARTLAWRLLTKVDITDRIAWLKAAALKGWTCEKEEVMRFLHWVVMTPAGYVDEESPLAQEVTRDLIEKGDDAPDVLKVKVKMPGKKECAELLAKMQGWEKPQEVKLNVSYEPPSKALERAAAKGVDLASILRKAGIIK